MAWNDGTLDLVAPLLTVEERFWAKVEVVGECWVWNAAKCREGYGRFAKVDGNTLAHRIAYQWLVGPIVEGMTLDHLCRNTSCVNPSHLEQVTASENSRRAGNWNRSKTHCVHGHAFSPENTYVAGDGRRQCRTCRDRIQASRRRRSTVRVSEGAE